MIENGTDLPYCKAANVLIRQSKCCQLQDIMSSISNADQADINSTGDGSGQSQAPARAANLLQSIQALKLS